MREAFEGKVEYLQVMDESGNVDRSTAPSGVDDKKIAEMYRSMNLARALDAKILSLQRQGRAVTYAPLLGEEATQIGSAMAMGPRDIFVPSFRQHGVYVARGAPLDAMFLYWRGYEEGCALPRSLGALPIIVPVATQMPHASGIAMAQKYLKTGAAVVVYVGDGGTSEGDFYEALNFAGVWKAPLVTIIENNQWAISVPRKDQTAAPTLAQKAMAAGIPGIQVDGNDVLAVYKATVEAIASSASGPQVIECITYRMSLHTTSDDPTKYRPDSEVEEWKKRDPLLRVRKYLEGKGLWDDAAQKALDEENSTRIDAAVDKAEKFVPDPRSMFTNMYSYVPEVLQEELDEAVAADFWQGEEK